MNMNRIKPQTTEMSMEKARIIARSMADGAIYKTGSDYTIKYEARDEELLKQFAVDIETVYGLKPIRDEYGTSGFTGKSIPRIRIRAREMFDDLVKYGPYRSENWRVPRKITKSKKGVKREFLRTFFDDEGSIVKKVIRLYSINEEGLKGIQRLLEEFDITSDLKNGFGARRNVHALVVKNYKKFAEEINFYCLRKRERLNKLLISG